MKIAVLGSAPSSCRKAPFGDPSWKIWGCSPGLYPIATKVDAWFELHRWEPPVIGKPDQQVPWFTPEYCAWMAGLPLVWMREPVPEIPRSRLLPHEDLVDKYGHFFFTSTIAWMMALAIETILADRKQRGASTDSDTIGLWGVDMAANEELYSGQRVGCQFFVTIAASLGITVYTPPESDLMVPPPLYGISEGDHRVIKYLTRKNELSAQKAHLEQQIGHAQMNLHHVNGALDDMQYWAMWLHEGEIRGARFEEIFGQSAKVEETEKPAAHAVPSRTYATNGLDRSEGLNAP